MQKIKNIFEFLNNNSGIVQTVAMVALAIITGVYAYFTYKMTKIMRKQIIPEIKISDIILGSSFENDWFLEELKKQPEQIGKNSCFKFKLLFNVYNKSSGSGSIEKPILALRFRNNNFEYRISPTTKESYDEKIEERGPMTIYKTIVNDFGGAIFLRGGEFHKIELEYNIYDPSKELLTHIRQNLKSLEYFIEFYDNFHKKYFLKIYEIQPERKTYRK